MGVRDFFSAFILLIFFSSDLFAGSNYNNLSVKIIQTNTELSYSFPMRLSTLLKDAYQFIDYTPYTEGAFLIDNAQQSTLEKQKYLIFQKLKSLQTPSANQVLEQLKKLSYGYKVPVTLDLDEIRMVKKKDPIISGSYRLYLPKRFKTINLIGDIGRSQKTSLNIKLGASLEDYLQGVSFQSNSKKNLSWVIQADKKIYRIEKLYWGGTPTYLSPGAIIYIGLDGLPDRFQNLNEEITQLLAEYVEM